MQAVGLRLQTIKSTQAMTEAMKGAAKAMKGYSTPTPPSHRIITLVPELFICFPSVILSS